MNPGRVPAPSVQQDDAIDIVIKSTFSNYWHVNSLTM